MKLSTKILAVAFVAAIALVAVSASAAGFDVNMTVGSSGPEVIALQQYLNANGFQVAATGAGSPGMESSYFGALTKAAVIKYQIAKGITPAAGYVGTITRGVLNAGGAMVPSTGALCPNGMTLASNCTQAPVTSGTVALCPNGMTLASNCTVAPGAGVPTVGVEGSFTVTLAANPSTATNITATQNVPVIGFNIKAQDSDITIDRLDLQVGVLYSPYAAADTLVPGAFINGISVMDGSTVLLSKNVTNADFTKDSNGVYYIRLTGLNFKVPVNTTKILSVAMNVNAIGGSDVAKKITVLGYGTSGIRGTDSAGFSEYADARGLTRSQTFAVSGSSTLTASADVNEVDSTNVKVDATDGAKNVPMGSFNVKSTTGDSTITDVTLDIVTDAATSRPATIYLWDGSTQLGSMTPTVKVAATQASTTFTDLTVSVPRNTTKTFTVTADFPADTAVANGTAVVSLSATGIGYDKPDGSSGTTANAVVSGNAMHLYPVSIGALTLVSATSVFTPSTATASSTIDGTLVMSVKADGGQVTKPIPADFVVYFASTTDRTLAARDGVLATTTAVTMSVTPDSDITDGSTATVTYKATLTMSASHTAGFYYMVLTSATTHATTASAQTWGLKNFFTPAQNLH